MVGGDNPKEVTIRESYVAAINRDGEILWEQKLENGAKHEQYLELIADDKGICVLPPQKKN